MTEQGFFFSNKNRQNAWYGIILMVIVLVLLFFLVQSLFRILYFLSPVLLILTLIIDYKVFIRFIKMLWSLLKNRTLYGILAVVLSIIGFPIVAGGLFITALMNRRIKKTAARFGATEEILQEKYSDFEIMEEDILDLEDPPMHEKGKKEE